MRRTAVWRGKVHLLAETGHAPSPEHATAATLDVRAALATLAPRERAVAVLRFYDGLTVPEIAHELGLSTGAVKRYLSDATARLRAALGPAALPDDLAPSSPGTGRSDA